jgi:hypothetical protein
MPVMHGIATEARSLSSIWYNMMLSLHDAASRLAAIVLCVLSHCRRCSCCCLQVSELQATAQQLEATNGDLRQQLAAVRGSQAELQQVQDRLAQAEQLGETVARLTAENSQVCSDLSKILCIITALPCTAHYASSRYSHAVPRVYWLSKQYGDKPTLLWFTAFCL